MLSGLGGLWSLHSSFQFEQINHCCGKWPRTLASPVSVTQWGIKHKPHWLHWFLAVSPGNSKHHQPKSLKDEAVVAFVINVGLPKTCSLFPVCLQWEILWSAGVICLGGNLKELQSFFLRDRCGDCAFSSSVFPFNSEWLLLTQQRAFCSLGSGGDLSHLLTTSRARNSLLQTSIPLGS